MSSIGRGVCGGVGDGMGLWGVGDGRADLCFRPLKREVRRVIQHVGLTLDVRRAEKGRRVRVNESARVCLYA